MSFDAKITVAAVLALMLEAAAGLVWTGGAAARLASVESRLALQAPVVERLARLEAQMADQQVALKRIEDKLDRSVRR